MPGESIVDLGGLTEPATVLIEKISDAVGGIAKPYQIVRVAKADAKADRIRAESEIQIEDLRIRAATRFVEEETRKQQNMENIVRKALPRLTDDAEPERMEDDWITNFFERSRIVSDEEMQELWARVLAGEANDSGSFSRKTINILHDVDRQAADLFRALCGFSWNIAGEDTRVLVYLDESDDPRGIYANCGIDYESLTDLQSLGLLSLEPRGVLQTELPSTFTASYFGSSIEVTLAAASAMQIRIGQVVLTASGRQFASICSAEPVDGFFEFVRARWEGDPSVASLKAL